MLLMFQALTGDDWSGLMRDAITPPSAPPLAHLRQLRGHHHEGAERSDAQMTGGLPAALPFFVSFVIVGAFVFLSLVVAVILERFSAVGGSDGAPPLVTPYDIEHFHQVWTSDFDPYSTMRIDRKDLPKLMLALPPPLGLKNVTGARGAKLHCMKLELLEWDDARGETITA